jgi:hypothetical protein
MRIYRSALFAALGASLLTVAGCGGSEPSGPTVGPAARVNVVTEPTATAPVGASAGTFAVKVVDAAGLAVSGVAVTFTTTGSATVAPTSATTDASGLASTQVTLGTIAGAVTVTGRAAGVTTAVTSAINVIAGPTTKIVVAPKTLQLIAIGDTARVLALAQDQYGNFAGTSTISYSVVDGTLVNVDATGLVRALRQGGTTFVISSANGKADTTTVTVLLAGSSNCTGLVGPTTMAVGDVQTFSGAQYGCLSGSASGAEFAMVAFNSSTDQTNSLSASITGKGLGAVPSTFAASTSAPALRSAIGTGSTALPQLDESFHLRLLAQMKAEHRSFAGGRATSRLAISRSITGGGAGVAINTTAIPGTAKVGDLLTVNVSAGSCSAPVNHALRVTAIGTKSIVLSDTLNPSGGFTDADFLRIATRFDTLVYPLDVGAFGAPTDIDNNGRVAIIFTRTVNELTTADNQTSFVGGFFNPRDLFPKVDPGTNRNNDCPGSNEGEMFYMIVPDPAGTVNGHAHTTGYVDSLTTGIIAHEFQHLINGSRRMYINTTATDFEDIWLNEGLSHIAEELLYYRESGFTPRQNLDDATIRVLFPAKYGIWKSDAASNLSRFLSYVRAPSANSVYADDDLLATRGATWSFLRYAADQLGTTDGTMWQRFDNATVTGLATLQSVFGTDPLPMVRNWAVANFLDDFGTNTDPRFMHKSWNFRNIFTTTFLYNPTYPLSVTGLSDGVKSDFVIRGGSAAYARLAVPAGREGLITFSSGGGLPSAPLQFVVVRTK